MTKQIVTLAHDSDNSEYVRKSATGGLELVQVRNGVEITTPVKVTVTGDKKTLFIGLAVA